MIDETDKFRNWLMISKCVNQPWSDSLT